MPSKQINNYKKKTEKSDLVSRPAMLLQLPSRVVIFTAAATEKHRHFNAGVHLESISAQEHPHFFKRDPTGKTNIAMRFY